mmetsp:Transcript_5513/g.19905  ORF Transcript_5513/g.19905 Transcript_5513/m.19905 type:complete len:325 (+) Transcript_5513:1798-2772(+)
MVHHIPWRQPAVLALPLGALAGQVLGLHPHHHQLQARPLQDGLLRHHRHATLPLVHPALLEDGGRARAHRQRAHRQRVVRQRLFVPVIPVLVVPKRGLPVELPHRLGGEPHPALRGAHEHHRVHRGLELGVLALLLVAPRLSRTLVVIPDPPLLQVQVGLRVLEGVQQLPLVLFEGRLAVHLAHPLLALFVQGRQRRRGRAALLGAGPEAPGARRRRGELRAGAQDVLQVDLHLGQELVHGPLVIPSAAPGRGRFGSLILTAAHAVFPDLLLEGPDRRQLHSRHLPARRTLSRAALVLSITSRVWVLPERTSRARTQRGFRRVF